MYESEFESYMERLKVRGEVLINNPELALKTLIQAGIVDELGNLTELYRE